MNSKFRVSKSTLIIFMLIFLLGIFLHFVRSDFVTNFQTFQTKTAIKEDTPSVFLLPKELQKQNVLILYNQEESASIELMDNLVNSLKYIKQGIELNPAQTISSNIQEYETVIITFEDLRAISDVTILERYVSNGGSVFFAIRPAMNDALNQIYRKLGIYEIGNFINTKGIQLHENILLNAEGFKTSEDFISNSSLAVGLNNKCHVYATSSNGVPLLWKVPYGNGNFMVFNGTMLNSKINRGLITGSLSVINEDFIYPVMNMKLYYIDGFPGAVSEGSTVHIYEDFKVSNDKFFRDIWWPFIQREGAKYGLKYTASMIYSYDELYEPSSQKGNIVQNQLLKYGREILKSGGELALFGYNSNPLQLSEHSSQEDMENGLDALNQIIKGSFPGYDVTTYVPPQSQLSTEGIDILDRMFPTINIVSSLYLGEKTSQNTLIQEYEVQEDKIYLPRITSGYDWTDEIKWVTANSITSLGVFSHSIYPLDALEPNAEWNDMSKTLHEINKETYDSYPWLRGMSSSEGAQNLYDFTNKEMVIERKDNSLTVHLSTYTGEMYFIFRTNKKITRVDNCSLKRIDQNVYLVTAEDVTFEIGLGDEK